MADTTDSLLREAREAYAAAVDADRHNIEQARRDLEFLAGEQWAPEDRQQRLRTGRPALTINRLPQYLRQVTGDMRLNPPGITVRPVDGGADPETAKIYNGLIRNIEAQSNAKAAYVGAGENAAACGIGYFRVTYDYTPGSFVMELGVGRIASPFGAIFYSDATEPTGCDAEGCFVQDLIATADYKKRFPNALVADWDEDGLAGRWRDGDFVRVAEWWRKVPVKRHLILTANGKVLDITGKDDQTAAFLVQTNGGVLQERMADSHRVEMRLINGVEQLEETHQWPGAYLPIVRVIGEETNIGDRIVRGGLIRNARDAQVLFNVQRSALAEAMAMAPKAKWLGTEKQFAAHKAKWANANQLNLPYLPYTPDEKAPGPPQRIAPEVPAQGLLADVTLAAQDIEATIGIYKENLGKESNAQSGRAILSRQREGDVGTFLYMDNLADAVAHCGRILVDLIPRIYDTARTVRILGEDGTHESVQINQTIPQVDGSVVVVNDLSVGRYDVVPSVGPSFSTKREEARESMMAYMGVQPQAAAMLGDLFAKSMDWPGADEFAKRMRRQAIMQGIVDPDPSNPEDAQLMQKMASQPPQPNPEAMLAQAEMGKAEAQKMRAQADAAVKAKELEVEQARLLLEAQRIKLEEARLMLEQQKVAAGNADTASKIQERETNSRIATVEAIQDTVERVLDRRMATIQAQQQAAPSIVVVGRHGEDDGEDKRHEAMQAVMANMTRAMEKMGAPRRIVRGPDGRAMGVE